MTAEESFDMPIPEPNSGFLWLGGTKHAAQAIAKFTQNRPIGQTLLQVFALALDAAVAERDAKACSHPDPAACISDNWNAGFREAETRATRLLAERDAAIAAKDADIRETLRAYSVHIPSWIVDHLERALAPTPALQERDADQPSTQPHDHNGNCRWRRSIVHTPGEEQATA